MVPAPHASHRVLIIEDDRDTREFLREFVACSGHEVHVAAEGFSGLALAERVLPDVAVLDIGLPTLDGYEIGRRLRANRGRSIRLIALTGNDDRARVVTAGFDDHILKPVRPERLRQALTP